MAQLDRLDKVALTFNPSALLGQQYTNLVLWTPVAMGVGIAAYFGLEQEPNPYWCLAMAAPVLLLFLGIGRRLGLVAFVLCWAAFGVIAGFSLAVWSAHRVAAPAISYPVGETVEGRVVEISRSASGRPRITLEDVVVYGVEPERLPSSVRLTILDETGELPVPSDRIRVYATLMPTGEPVEPGGFDFHRRAFFDGLGAVGLTRGVLTRVALSEGLSLLDKIRSQIAWVRNQISKALREVLPGAEGGFAAAILVGDRAWINEADQEALRASNLAHLLAISGLHMGILTGLVFAVFRGGLALVPIATTQVSTKKIAAVVALIAGCAYLMLSGATIATQRAFIMVAVALTAVLLDRPALTLRALAVAAIIVLAIRPISLLDAGFQMSFAATAALIGGFSWVRGRMRTPHWLDRTGPFKVVATYVTALLFASLLAGIATAPFAAFHFNRTAPYGLIANLLAVPIMGFVIAPAACIAAVLAPLGWAEWPLRVMGEGISQILNVAHSVSDLPGAVQPVGAVAPEALILVVAGGLWILLWKGGARTLGLAAIAGGLALWSTPPPRPDLIVAPQARLIGKMTPQGRALDHPTAQGYAAKTWLRRDGDMATQIEAAERGQFNKDAGWTHTDLEDGWSLAVAWGKNVDRKALSDNCRAKVLVISKSYDRPEGSFIFVSRKDLDSSGALAVTMTAKGPELTFSRASTRNRLWTPKRRSKRDQ